MKNITLRLLSLIIVFSCCSLAFTSCGSDDDGPTGADLKEELQGYWVAKQITVKALGQTITYDEDDFDDLKGEAGVAGFYDQTLDFQGNYVNGTSYTIKDDKINVPAWYGDIWGKVKLSGSRLKITYEMDLEGISCTVTIDYARGARNARSTSDHDNASGLLHAISCPE
ncbi:hypothetical protein [uncultured Duncaniella sp.]|uniref:hypothetical protein n=1 Tax=uncultured Duncaniella sp. TaxID=2768039 RepID=UPI00265B136C|nr:hypothetical protein [uncultured Duncaniella sp.]